MPKTIMLIDDSYTLRQMVRMTLTKDGYEILQAEDGLDALDKLDKLGAQDIDLFICDLNMPKMDGMSFVKALKDRSDFRYTPIMMLTTETESSVKEDAKSLGIKIWMTKPFEPTRISQSVRKLLMP